MHSSARYLSFINFYNYSYLTVPHRFFHLLMLYFVMALQVMAPFVHVHAGPVQFGHAALLHEHPGTHGDVAYSVIEGDKHGVVVAGVQEMPLRQEVLLAADAGASYPVPVVLPPGTPAGNRGTAWTAAPPLHLSRLDHALPNALAPPLR